MVRRVLDLRAGQRPPREGDDAGLQRLIVSNASRDEIDAHLTARGLRSLRHDGFERVIAGDTTVEEVLRVANS